MNIELPDDCSLAEAIATVRRVWIETQRQPDETLLQLAARIGVHYRSVHRWMTEDHARTRVHKAKEFEPCLFCGSIKEIHQHHIVNRKASPVTLPLCAQCHRKFHSLNKRYEQPNT